jgi:hypothetical protein
MQGDAIYEKRTIFSICISPKMGMAKREVQEARVMEHGIENDGYAGEWGRQWGRQISFLNLSSVLNVNEENNLQAGPVLLMKTFLSKG